MRNRSASHSRSHQQLRTAADVYFGSNGNHRPATYSDTISFFEPFSKPNNRTVACSTCSNPTAGNIHAYLDTYTNRADRSRSDGYPYSTDSSDEPVAYFRTSDGYKYSPDIYSRAITNAITNANGGRANRYSYRRDKSGTGGSRQRDLCNQLRSLPLDG
jgi:hypothetical protein